MFLFKFHEVYPQRYGTQTHLLHMQHQSELEHPLYQQAQLYRYECEHRLPRRRVRGLRRLFLGRRAHRLLLRQLQVLHPKQEARNERSDTD